MPLVRRFVHAFWSSGRASRCGRCALLRGRPRMPTETHASRGKPSRQLCGRALEVFRWRVHDARATNACSPVPKACVVGEAIIRFNDNGVLGHDAPHFLLPRCLTLCRRTAAPGSRLFSNKFDAARFKGAPIIQCGSRIIAVRPLGVQRIARRPARD